MLWCYIVMSLKYEPMIPSSLSHPIAITRDMDGVLRVDQTRVTLDTIVTAYELGETPEQIVQQFPSLNLEQVYSAISFYLHNQTELKTYLEARRQQGQQNLEQISQKPHMQGIRQCLMARLKPQDQ